LPTTFVAPVAMVTLVLPGLAMTAVSKLPGMMAGDQFVAVF